MHPALSESPLPPLVKWPGSKRTVAYELASLLPEHGTYFEPFLGGGAMLGLQAHRHTVVGDIVPELISIWISVQSDPDVVCDEYTIRWDRLQRKGFEAFYEIRDDFNESRSPHDLLFLSRTCVNGLIRFNKNGEFNNSLHHTRKGIQPERFRKVVNLWNRALEDTVIQCTDYEVLLLKAVRGDVVFLDPPYVGTRGRYHPVDFDFDRLWRVMGELTTRGVNWMLTLDGSAGDRDYGLNWVPEKLYLVRRSIATGSSPFSRLMEGRVDRVEESVFLNFYPQVRADECTDVIGDHVAQLTFSDNM
jgi:DNA adenine methylase